MKEYSLSGIAELRKLVNEGPSLKARRIRSEPDRFFVHFIHYKNDPWAQIKVLNPKGTFMLPGPGRWVYIKVDQRTLAEISRPPKRAQVVPSWVTEVLEEECVVTDEIRSSGEGVVERRTSPVLAVILRQQVVLNAPRGFKVGEIGDYLVWYPSDEGTAFDVVNTSVWQEDFSEIV